MAVSTAEFTLTKDDWTQLSDGHTQVLVQPRSLGSILIHLGTSAPASSSHVGILLTDFREFSATDLVTGDQVYGRSAHDDSELVTVARTI